MTGRSLQGDLRLAAAAIDAGRLVCPIAWWRLGLALRAAADRGLVRENLPILVHKAALAIAADMAATLDAPGPETVAATADRLWLLADCIDGWNRLAPRAPDAGAAPGAVPGPEDFWP